MAGRSHGDAGGEIKELIAVHIFNDDAASTLGDQRIRTCVGRRKVLLIARDDALRVGTRNRSLELGAGS